MERFQELTACVLPQMAKQQQWPIRFDHCFKRICLDNAFGGIWHEHIKRPASRNLQEAELSRAIEIAEHMVKFGRSVLGDLNCNSLRWRGKL